MMHADSTGNFQEFWCGFWCTISSTMLKKNDKKIGLFKADENFRAFTDETIGLSTMVFQHLNVMMTTGKQRL